MAQGSRQEVRKRSLDPDSDAIDGERWLISIGYTDKSTKNVMVCVIFEPVRDSVCLKK